MAPPAVVHVAQPTEAGVARCVASYARDQVRRGWRVAVASPAGPLAADALAAGGVHLPWAASRSPTPSTAGEARRLAALVRAWDPDVVHLHSSKAGLAGRLAIRAARPTIFQPHAWSFEAADGVVGRAAAAWERFSARWTHVIVAVSEAERDRGKAAGVRGCYRVVPNGVDLSAWRPAGTAERAAARHELGLPDAPLAVCVGRLCHQKGQDLLLDAWPTVAAEMPGARLALVGDGPSAAALRRRAGDGVVLAGPSDDVPVWLAAADIVAVPSRWEGMALVTLEAMARARPVVATDVPGMREAVGAEAGAVVVPEDPSALAAAILERLSDPARAAAEGEAARVRAERLFDLRRSCDEIASLTMELTLAG